MQTPPSFIWSTEFVETKRFQDDADRAPKRFRLFGSIIFLLGVNVLEMKSDQHGRWLNRVFMFDLQELMMLSSAR